MIIRRHNRCVGIRLWKWGKFQIEAWFIPKHEKIEEHVHERINSLILMVHGKLMGSMLGKVGLLKRWHLYHIQAGIAHGAVSESFCIFLNFEHWIGEVTSAAEDFRAV